MLLLDINNLNKLKNNIFIMKFYAEEGIKSIVRKANYLSELYEIKEIVNFSNNVDKIYASTRDKFLNVIITKNYLCEEEDYINRIKIMIHLVEENVILVENLWIDEDTTSSKSNFFI